jgi:hypothetical protein
MAGDRATLSKAAADILLAVRFEPRHGSFSDTFRHDPVVTATTEIFLPHLQYLRGDRVVSNGDWDRRSEHHLVLFRYISRVPSTPSRFTARHNERPNLSRLQLGDRGLQVQGVKKRVQLIQSQAYCLIPLRARPIIS